jgi:hypothetical protein
MHVSRYSENEGREPAPGAEIDSVGDIVRHVRDELQGIIDVACPKVINILAAHELDGRIPPD